MPARIENNFDALHCLPFTVAAAIETLTGRHISVAEAESIVGFREGAETWVFKTMLWFVSNGFEVRYYDDFDTDAFIRDPRRFYLDSGESEATVDHILSITDFEVEVTLLRQCLESPEFTLVAESPTADLVLEALDDGWLPMISLNATILNNRESRGYDAHIVLATGFDQGTVRLQDSGPPAKWDWDVLSDSLNAAIHSPTENSGNAILVRLRHPK